MRETVSYLWIIFLLFCSIVLTFSLIFYTQESNNISRKISTTSKFNEGDCLARIEQKREYEYWENTTRDDVAFYEVLGVGKQHYHLIYLVPAMLNGVEVSTGDHTAISFIDKFFKKVLCQ